MVARLKLEAHLATEHNLLWEAVDDFPRAPAER